MLKNTPNTVNAKTGKAEYMDMLKLSKIHIRRHVKIKGEANPFDDQYAEYFKLRKEKPWRGKTRVFDTIPYHQLNELLGRSYGCRKA